MWVTQLGNSLASVRIGKCKNPDELLSNTEHLKTNQTSQGRAADSEQQQNATRHKSVLAVRLSGRASAE